MITYLIMIALGLIFGIFHVFLKLSRIFRFIFAIIIWVGFWITLEYLIGFTFFATYILATIILDFIIEQREFTIKQKSEKAV